MTPQDPTLEQPETRDTLDIDAQALEEAMRAEEQSEEAQTASTEDVSESQDRYLRLASEFDNFRKRTVREKDQLVRSTTVDLLRVFLPILDDLERTLKAAEQTDNLEALQKGVRLVHKNVRNALDKQGVRPYDALGQPFDSDLHEAIAQMPAAEDDLKGKVVEEVEKGYTYREQVIRYAKVIIGE